MLTVALGSILVLVLGYQGSKRDANKRWQWWLLAAVISVIMSMTYMGMSAGYLADFVVAGINVLFLGALMTLAGIGLMQSHTGHRLVDKTKQGVKDFAKDKD